MTFHSNENKSMLWNILLEHGLFNGIASNLQPEIKGVFNENVTLLLNKSNTSSLIDLNKEFIQKMMKIIPMFKGICPPKSENKIEEVYTAEKIKSNRVDGFNKELVNAKNDFDSAIKLKKPEDINFNDNTNEFNSDIDKDLVVAIAARRLDIEKMSASQQSSINEASQWINSNNSNKSESETENENERVKKKHVTFNDIAEFSKLLSQPVEPDNISKTSEPDIRSILETIIENQKEILILLNK